MFFFSCTFIELFLFLLGTSGNSLCIIIFCRQKFRQRIITPYFIILLLADTIYLFFRLIKLFYYSQTLFYSKISLCSNTTLVQFYQYATQTWPQIFIPFIHSETYIRFSIILMCIISVQRTTFITQSLKRLVLPTLYNNKCKHKWTLIFIIISFSLAYSLEFFGLTIFCSKSNNHDLSYQWFIYMAKHMKNSSYLLIDSIKNQSNSSLKCINDHLDKIQNENQTKMICSNEKLINILSFYFDQHQRSIVSLIQKLIHHQTGYHITRNEIRRKYHFHECVFPLNSQIFHRHYDFMYRRTFGFNRYTLILVFGSILPSLITIISNTLTILRIRKLNRLTFNYLTAYRRRTDDTRRVLIIITIECLFAIVKAWFGDMLISVIYCKGTLLAEDDCPKYLKSNYTFLIMFDMFNSISNIILHCLCEKHFRHQLYQMNQYWYQLIRRFFTNICCFYFKIHHQRNKEQSYVYYDVSVTTHASSTSLDNQNYEHVYLKIRQSRKIRSNLCCNCQRCFSLWTQTYFSKNQTIRSTSTRNSMTLLQQQTLITQKLSIT